MFKQPFHKALLIDDSEVDLFVQKRFIELSGFADSITTSKSSKEALAYLQNLKEAENPEIIFLDLNMPEVDGFGFLEKLEELPTPLKTRIVVLSSSNNPQDRERALHFNKVVQFVSKPLSTTLLAEIKKSFPD